MRLIDRYVLGSTLTAALYGVIVLSVVLVLGNVFKEALDLLINRNVPARYLLNFIACVLPFSLTFTVPWAFLTAILLVLGRMSADHETVALRACGVSLLRAFLPVIAAGAILTVFCIWLNISINPRAELAMRESLADMARSSPESLFVAGEVIDQFEGKKLFIRSRRNEWLEGVTLFEETEEGLPIRVTHARFGRIRPSQDRRSIILDLWNANFEMRDTNDPSDSEKIQHGAFVRKLSFPISLEGLSGGWLSRPLRTYTLPELLGFISSGPHRENAPSRTGVLTEISKRFSLGFASLAFAFVAIPLGVVAQRRETSAGFGLSLLVAFFYFAFVELAHTLRENADAYPYLVLWIPNVLFLVFGGWLLVRLDRR